MHARPYLLAAIVTLVSCASLDPLTGGTCGNGVIEDAEDCDAHDIGAFKCGAPGSAHACQITCTDSPCPDGWGCSVDGVCRQPDGTFPKAADPVSSGVNSLHVGDFDGDGRKDILGLGLRSADNTARARVLYFGDDAVLEHTTLLTAPLASPTIRNFDLDADNTDDFAFGALDQGFGVMTGRKDRTLVPVLFPSFTIPKAQVKPIVIHGTRRQLPDSEIDASVDPSTTWSLLYAGQVDAAGTWVVTSLTSDTKGSYLRPLAGVTQDQGLAGDPQWADLFSALPDTGGADATTCGEVVVAWNTSSGGEIDVFSPCKPQGLDKAVWASERPPSVIALAKRLIGGVHIADVNGDKHLDVVFATDTTQTMVAYGDGRALGTPVPFTTLAEVPIASGDLNGDGTIDFVTPSSLVVSEAGPLGLAGKAYTHLTSSRRTRWTSARFGNVSTLMPGADAGGPTLGSDSPPKIAFVAAASADQPDIDYFQGVTGSLLPTPSTIPTNGPVSVLEVGDFDGDTQDDVAFVENNSATGSQDLVYAYGRGVGPPEAPAIVGGLSGAVALVPSPSSSAIVPLVVFTDQPVQGSLATLGAAIVLGSGDRQPLAPLLLADGNAIAPLPDSSPLIRRWAPLSVMSGPLQDANRVDLTAIAVGYTYDALGALERPPYPVGPWIANGQGPASFGEAAQVGDLLMGPTSSIEFIDPKTYNYSATIIAADIDKPKNGVIEILGLARTTKQEPQLVVVRVPNQKGAQPEVALTSLAVDGVGLSGPALRALDVDGDGADDVVAQLATTTSTPTNPQTKLVVYLNQGGTFQAPPGLTVPIPAPPPTMMDYGPTSVTQITIAAASPTAGGATTRALAIATQRRVFLATLKADKSGFDVSELTRFGASGLRGATGIGAGDYDGDGVEDLAIADAGSVRILLQKSTEASRAEQK